MGLDLIARVNAATHYDDFEAANGTALAGRAMLRGGLSWTQSQASGATTTGNIQSGAAKATAGTGNCLIHFAPGTLNFDIVATLAAKASNPVASIAFRALSVNEHYQMALRVTGSGSEYSLFRRNADLTGTQLIASGVTPAVNDRIRIRMRDNVATFFVNGTQIMQYTTTTYNDRSNVGMNLNGTDVTTGFADFNYYGRA